MTPKASSNAPRTNRRAGHANKRDRSNDNLDRSANPLEYSKGFACLRRLRTELTKCTKRHVTAFDAGSHELSDWISRTGGSAKITLCARDKMIRLDSDRQSKTSWAAAIFLLGLLAVCSARAVELKPSFPNHAIVLTPEATPRGVTPKLDDVDIPFTWDQTCVVAEGTTSDRVYRGFDPLFQPIVVNILSRYPDVLESGRLRRQ